MAPNTIRESRLALYKTVFDEVIEHYHTLKSAAGIGVKSLNYAKASESAGNTANVVSVSPSDFICDVEIASRRALASRPDLHGLFTQCYIYCVQEPDTATVEIDTIRSQVGRVFVERRLHPVAGYFKPKFIDKGQAK